MNYIKLYADFLKKAVNIKKPLRVVFDCSNGTTGLVIEKLRNLEIKKLEIILINDSPDGNFPAHGPNPMLKGAMDDLSKAVLKNKADLGVIFDADGDRVFFIDDKGRLIIPDAAIFLLAKNFKGPVILPVNVGILARELLAEDRRKIIDSRIGHYFIKKLIREKKINFAAEISGHYYFKKFFYADSGIFSAIQMMNQVSSIKCHVSSIKYHVSSIKYQERRLSEWIDQLPRYYRSGEINFKTQDKEAAIKRVERAYASKSRKISRLDGLTMEFGTRKALARGKRSRNTNVPTQITENNEWRFNLRPSNTEDLLRLNLEAKDKKIFNKELETIKKLL